MGQKEEEGPPKLNSAACSTQLVLASGTLVAAIFQSRTCRILPRAGARRGHTSSEPGWVVHDPTGSSDEPEREREAIYSGEARSSQVPQCCCQSSWVTWVYSRKIWWATCLASARATTNSCNRSSAGQTSRYLESISKLELQCQGST